MNLYERITEHWRTYPMETAEDVAFHLRDFRVLFAFHSGKIENSLITYHTTRDVFENGAVRGYTGDTRTLFELENQKTCYDFLLPKIAAREPLSRELLLEVHAILTAGTYDERRFLELGERPGHFRTHDFVIGTEEVGAPHEAVEHDILDLLNELAGHDASDALKTAAYFHLRFEYIHPFADGNGRAGRTLLNYYLMTRNHPPIIVFDEDKGLYYAALEAYDKEEQIDPLYRFLQDQTCKTWEKAMTKERLRDAPTHDR